MTLITKILLLLLPLMAGFNPVIINGNDFDFIVSADGSGDFTTVQEAFNSVPDFRKNPTRIFIKNGTYKEKLVLATSKTNVWIFGEEPEKVILTYDDFAQKLNRFGEEMGTTGSSSFFVFGDGFRARNITFQNSAGPVGQAVAVRVTGDAPEHSFYLGRPWRNFGQSVFIRCQLGSMIRPEGWHNWNKPEAEGTAFFAEYKNTGPGAKGQRVAWSHQLTDKQAAEYTQEKVLGEWVREFLEERGEN